MMLKRTGLRLSPCLIPVDTGISSVTAIFLTYPFEYLGKIKANVEVFIKIDRFFC
jgi:hypothetical protein